MPIKQVVCKICGEMVNKAQTYHVGDGHRACKKHAGVVEKKETLEGQRQKKADAWRDKEKIRLDLLTERREADRAPLSMKPKCWVCMNEGLRQDSFFMRVLIEMQKQEIIHGGPVNIFDPKNRILMKERCIFILAKEKCEPIMKYVRDEFLMGIQMVGAVAICGQCCGNFKIDPLRKVEWDELTTHMAVHEVVVKPVLQKIAGLELARDN